MAEKNPNDTDQRETSILRPDSARGTPLPAGAAPGAKTGHLPAPWRLLVQIGEQSQTTVGLEVKGELILGRVDPMADVQPDLDLTPYGGQEAGVSRRHIAITRDDENRVLYVEDLNSTNGTRLNGFWLDAGRRYRLRDGDRLDLGDLTITLRFARSPYPSY
jgi:pSer/pThr/pTyr-binding forkhead associated (FHA) protein